jgi:hypothetical protein
MPLQLAIECSSAAAHIGVVHREAGRGKENANRKPIRQITLYRGIALELWSLIVIETCSDLSASIQYRTFVKPNLLPTIAYLHWLVNYSSDLCHPRM